MGSTRALFASIGVSVSLVAAAAMSLFTVSVVIAFGGWSAGMGESTMPSALIIDGSAATRTAAETTRMATRSSTCCTASLTGGPSGAVTSLSASPVL